MSEFNKNTQGLEQLNKEKFMSYRKKCSIIKGCISADLDRFYIVNYDKKNSFIYKPIIFEGQEGNFVIQDLNEKMDEVLKVEGSMVITSTKIFDIEKFSHSKYLRNNPREISLESSNIDPKDVFSIQKLMYRIGNPGERGTFKFYDCLILKNGKVVILGDNIPEEFSKLMKWEDIVQIIKHIRGFIGLKKDGSLIYSEDSDLEYLWKKKIESFKNIIQIASGDKLYLLNDDGCVYNVNLRNDEIKYKNVVQIEASYKVTLFVHLDGTVSMVTNDPMIEKKFEFLKKWKDIVAVSISNCMDSFCVIGVTKNGNVKIMYLSDKEELFDEDSIYIDVEDVECVFNDFDAIGETNIIPKKRRVMTCPMCGSRRFVEESNAYVCQECETPYPLKEREMLMVEESNENKKRVRKGYLDLNLNIKPLSCNNKDELLSMLIMWANYLNGLFEFNDVSDINVNIEKIFSSPFPETYFLTHYSLFPSKDNYISILENNLLYGIDKKSGKLVKSKFVKEKDIFAYNFYLERIKGQSFSQKLIDLYNVLKNNFTIKTAGNASYTSRFTYANKVYQGEGIKLWQFDDPQKSFYEWYISSIIPILKKEDSEIDKYVIIEKKPTGFLGLGPTKEIMIFDMSPIIKEAKKIYQNIIRNISDQYIEFFDNNLLEFYDERKESFIHYIEYSKKMGKIFDLPIKYRKIDVIYRLIEMVNDGKAENWKELVNLYDTIIHRENVESSLKEISNRINELNNTIYYGLEGINNSLISINSGINYMNYQLAESNKKLEKIKKNTFGILWEIL